MTTQEQQIQSVTEASEGAAIVLSGPNSPVPDKPKKKRKGQGGVTKIKPVPADTADALVRQDGAGAAIDLATEQSPLTEEEKREILEILRQGKGARLTEISNFAAQVSAQLDSEIAAALAQQADIQRQKRAKAEAYMPDIEFADLGALIESIAKRGRDLPDEEQED